MGHPALHLPDRTTHADNGNPHVCVLRDVPCLACALIEVMGEDRRPEALDLAHRLAESTELAVESVLSGLAPPDRVLSLPLTRTVLDSDGNNATASLLLNGHHDVAVYRDVAGFDHCELCRFAVGWLQPTRLGPATWGHSTACSTEDVLLWIDAR